MIGNKNYSSWSLRGWLMCKLAGIEFEEIAGALWTLPETQPDDPHALALGSRAGAAAIASLAVWDSLAIGEYLNDLKPAARPVARGGPAARAHRPRGLDRDACGLFRAARQDAR